MMNRLNPEEQELLDSVENGEWRSVPKLAQEIARYQRYAQAQSDAMAEVRVEIPAHDLQSLQELAQQADVSLQLLIGDILHQYISDTQS